MLILAIKGSKNIKNATVISYDELFERYKNSCKKSYWKTQEGFYLDWLGCGTIKQMKQCIFVYPDNEDVAFYIRENYEVLDENDINY